MKCVLNVRGDTGATEYSSESKFSCEFTGVYGFFNLVFKMNI